MEAGTTMTGLARTEQPSHDTADLSPSVAARHACRSGMASTTAGVANGFVQGNLVILPEKLAGPFHRFCQLNPKPCPIIGMSDAGDAALATLAPPTAFALASALTLFVCYLSYATPPGWTLYYYETGPAFAYLTAAGIAWVCARFARNSTEIRRSPWAVPLLAPAMVALLMALPGAVMLRRAHFASTPNKKSLARFDQLLSNIPEPRAIVFVHYAATHNPNAPFVRNSIDLEQERVWRVYDRGPEENAALRAVARDRASYRFDEHTWSLVPCDLASCGGESP